MTDEKLLVEICVGTTCFVLGAAALQSLEDFLPSEIKDKVDVVGSPCLNCCRNRNDGNAPFVRIGGKHIVGNASIQKVIAKIEEVLAEGQKDA